ncbi:unnamed protein product [Cylindrotheca closterium]|uniref:Uncharacterized protein n=1 Tax=Cylindrotheca closterium TaxID=2856 RepID=A0AAD2CUH6_9STRA|nr:unnamed protein product [Cylindrotheca closterium]
MSITARRMEQERQEARTRLAATNMGQEQPPPSVPTLVDRTRPVISTNPTHLPASTSQAILEEPPRPAFHQAAQADSSKGNEEEIHGISITSLGIDRAMMPEGIKNAKIKGSWDRASNMAALPGKCSPGGGDSESGGAGEEVMNQLLETFGSDSTKIALLDTGYCRKSRHGLGLITSSNKLHEACQKVLKKEEDTFKNQRFQFLHYLVRLGYSTEFVEDYVERGLMPRIIKETYVNFLALLNKIRHKDMGADEAWEDSEAYVILQVHSENLLDICTNSNSKKMLLLQNYIYLCDARKKDFCSNTITEKNIERVNKTNQKLQRELESLWAAKGRGGREPTKDKDKEGDSTLKKCSQCKSRTLQTALKLKHNKTVCPPGRACRLMGQGRGGTSCYCRLGQQGAPGWRYYQGSIRQLAQEILGRGRNWQPPEVPHMWYTLEQNSGGAAWSTLGTYPKGRRKAIYYFGDHHSEGTTERSPLWGQCTHHTSSQMKQSLIIQTASYNQHPPPPPHL